MADGQNIAGNMSRVTAFGIAVGLAAITLIPYLIWEEERNLVLAHEVGSQVVEMSNISTVDPTMEGKVVHAVGVAKAVGQVMERDLGLTVDAIAVCKKVRYRQWRIKEDSRRGALGRYYEYSVDGEAWESERMPGIDEIDLGVGDEIDEESVKEHGKDAGRNYVLKEFREADVAPVVTFGAYVLADTQKVIIGQLFADEEGRLDIEMDRWHRGVLNDEISKTARKERGETGAWETEWIHVGGDTVSIYETRGEAGEVVTRKAIYDKPRNYVYIGKDPVNPQIGDAEVEYTKSPSEVTVSILAKVRGGTFEAMDFHGAKMIEVVRGEMSAEEMIAEYVDSTGYIRNGLCGVLIFLMIVAMMIVEWLPLMLGVWGSKNVWQRAVCGALIGAAVCSLVLGVRWILHEPLAGCGLIAMAVLIVVGLRKLRGGREEGEKRERRGRKM